MLNKAFEWYRIVNVQPSSQTIDNRIEAARDIVNAIDEKTDLDLMLSCAAGVVAGFERTFTQESPIVQLLVSAIRAHESAFPQDLSENALELRACAAVVLGEFLVRDGDEEPADDALLIASVLRSGLGVRPSPVGRHLKQLLDELDDLAAKVLASGGLSRRMQLTTIVKRFEKLPDPADLSTAWKSLLSALKGAMDDIAKQSAIDREELNILWWMFAGVSTTTGNPLAEMPVGASVLCCGAELGSQCLVPPTSSLEAMVRRAYDNGRKSQERTDRSIEKIAAGWVGQLPKVLVPDDAARALAKEYPSLFPLSWLCDRLLASKGAADWSGEFESMTGIPSSHTCPPANWAIQAFRERVAHRAHAKGI